MSLVKLKAKARAFISDTPKNPSPAIVEEREPEEIAKNALIESLANDVIETIDKVDGPLNKLTSPVAIASTQTLKHVRASVVTILLRAGVQQADANGFDNLQDLHTHLESLAAAIEVDSGDIDAQDAINKFDEFAKEWIYRPIRSLPNFSNEWLYHSTPITGKPADDDGDVITSVVIPTSANDKLKCPLEVVLRQAGYLKEGANPLPDFLHWAKTEKTFSDVHLRVGVVRSVHLFRHQKAPFYHEYALICLQAPNLPQSWIRVERAARFKAHLLRVQADSLKPLTSGVTLRESVSFGTSKESLSADSDEYATIVVEEPAMSQYALFLYEVAQFIASTSEAFPRYQLFTANCRYFARSLVLNIAQRFENRAATYLWKSKPASLQRLNDKLRSEQFGGHQLEGERAALVKAATKLELARTQMISSTSASARETCAEARAVLDSLKSESPTRQYLLALCEHVSGQVAAHSAHTNSMDLALTHHKRAYELISPIRSESPDYGLLWLDTIDGVAHSYYWTGHPAKAVTTREEAVEGWRAEIRKRNPQAVLNLARVLSEQAFEMTKVAYGPTYHPNIINLITEAGALARKAYAERPEYARSMLIDILDKYRSVLKALVREDSSGVLAKTLETVTLLNKIFDPPHDPEQDGMRFHSFLDIKGGMPTNEPAPWVGEHFEDLVAGYRASYNLEKDVPRVKDPMADMSDYNATLDAIALDYSRDHKFTALAEALRSQAKSYLPNEPSKALEPMRECVEVFKQLYTERRNRHRGTLMDAIRGYAKIKESAGDLEGAYEASQEYLVYAREEFSNRRESEVHQHLAHNLRTLASYARRLKRWDDARDAHKEAVEHIRHLCDHPRAKKEKDPNKASEGIGSGDKKWVDVDEKDHRPFLARALISYAGSLERTGDIETAFSTSQETVSITRILLGETFEPASLTNNRVDLAERLVVQANHARQLKRWKDAAGAGVEAAVHYRILYEVSPAEYRSDFASMLSDLVKDLRNDQQKEAATAAMAEAVGLYRLMYSSKKVSGQQKLAAVLAKYASILSWAGDPEKAVLVGSELITLTQRVLLEKPAARKSLADRLRDRAVDEGTLHRWDDAVVSQEEAVVHYRHLHQNAPETYRDDLISALRELGKDFKRASRDSEAEIADAEANQMKHTQDVCDPPLIQ